MTPTDLREEIEWCRLGLDSEDYDLAVVEGWLSACHPDTRRAVRGYVGEARRKIQEAIKLLEEAEESLENIIQSP